MQSMQVKQIIFLLVILLAFLIIFGLLIYTGSANAMINEEISLVKRKLIKYENSSITIDADEVIDSDIVIKNGSITIAGEIHGNLIAIDADIYLETKSKIFGNIVIYKGEVVRNEQTGVGGDIALVTDDGVDITEGRQLPGYDFRLNVFKSDMRIEQDQTNYGDILIFDGDIEIDGKVDGCVINFFGETTINDNAAVDGNVIAFKGPITVAKDALVTGRAIRLDSGEQIAKSDEEDRAFREKIERKYLKRDRKENSNIFRFWGNVSIEPDEFIRGDVVTLRGTVHVQGEVDGDVVAVFGNVELDSTAWVNGDVVSVGGKIYRSRNAHVGGDIVQTSITGVRVNNGDQHTSVGRTRYSVRSKKGDEWEQKKYRPTRSRWDQDFENDPFMFRYDRVEGFFLGLRLNRDDWRDRSSWFDLYGHAGYGFARKHGCYQIGVERSFFGKWGPILGVEAHDIVYTEDDWIIPTFENSLAALFLREDFRDYFRRVGFSGYLSHDISEYLTLTGEFRKDHDYNLKKKTNWSIFGGDKKFRANPLIDEIEFKSAVAKLTLDTRNSYKYPDQGWLISLMGEFAGKDFNKNGVDFDRFIFDIRRYQPITYGENLDFRVRVGSSRGDLPPQFQFDLGGISTLRGYKFKEFAHDSANPYNRLILGNIEYRIHGRRNPLNTFLGGDISLILFADAGYVWTVSDTLRANDGFEDLDWDDLHTSLGFAISNRDGNVRLNFAKAMGRKGAPILVTFRLNRPF